MNRLSLPALSVMSVFLCAGCASSRYATVHLGETTKEELCATFGDSGVLGDRLFTHGEATRRPARVDLMAVAVDEDGVAWAKTLQHVAITHWVAFGTAAFESRTEFKLDDARFKAAVDNCVDGSLAGSVFSAIAPALKKLERQSTNPSTRESARKMRLLANILSLCDFNSVSQEQAPLAILLGAYVHGVTCAAVDLPQTARDTGWVDGDDAVVLALPSVLSAITLALSDDVTEKARDVALLSGPAGTTLESDSLYVRKLGAGHYEFVVRNSKTLPPWDGDLLEAAFGN